MSDCCEPGNTQSTTPDLLVIGAGSAGFSAAITAAGSGADVVIAGDGTIGGTCVNVGCVPSKNLIRAMQAIHDVTDMSRFEGIQGAGRISDWPALVRQKDGLVEDLRKAKYEDLLAAYPNISYTAGRARFTGNGTEVDVAGTAYRAGKIILATGASPVLPQQLLVKKFFTPKRSWFRRDMISPAAQNPKTGPIGRKPAQPAGSMR